MLLLVCLATSLAALSFEAEELSFKINQGSWRMDGRFYFVNYLADPVSQLIYFPIPVDSLCLRPEILRVELEEADSLTSCTLVQQDAKGFSFRLQLPERGFCTVHIAYTQRLLGNRASYIITTANSWGKPLSYASYKLILEDGISLLHPPFSFQEHSGDSYFWEFYDFSPKGEFEVLFTPAPQGGQHQGGQSPD